MCCVVSTEAVRCVIGRYLARMRSNTEGFFGIFSPRRHVWSSRLACRSEARLIGVPSQTRQSEFQETRSILYEHQFQRPPGNTMRSCCSQCSRETMSRLRYAGLDFTSSGFLAGLPLRFLSAAVLLLGAVLDMLASSDTIFAFDAAVTTMKCTSSFLPPVAGSQCKSPSSSHSVLHSTPVICLTTFATYDGPIPNGQELESKRRGERAIRVRSGEDDSNDFLILKWDLSWSRGV